MAKKAILSTKLVVTNRSALLTKYGPAGVKAVESAVKALTAADRKRGLATSLVYLDGAALGQARVTDPADPAENKTAIDILAKKHRPEYLVILGSRDVVPYQDLKNKLHDPADPESDPDRFAFSDLPYACEAPYSQAVTKFLGPTRVVGRIPDITAAKRPTYLLALLKASAAAKPSTRPDSGFAISAKVWGKSTKMSVRNLFGAAPGVLISPNAGPKFAAKQLGAKVHFVNCHGDESSHTFSGEGPREKYFTAMDARKLTGVMRGTVAAFECCYGAELYDPQGLPAQSIANEYLAQGAPGLVASTTIAYGPAAGNANADLICQFFLDHVLKGASLGRALLEARLAYIRSQSVADPYDEKTLAQFVLLGDPSLHPFVEEADGATAGPKVSGAVHAARLQRRVRLMKAGERMARETAYTVRATETQTKNALKRKALKGARKRFTHLRVFEVREPSVDGKAIGKALGDMPKAREVFVAVRRLPAGSKGSKTCRLEGYLAYQVDGQLVQIDLLSH
jgi:GNAT superfamily N-acetyltransferase